MTLKFDKPFTQQEPIPTDAIARAVEVLETGRLHRYNVVPGEEGEVALLEAEYAVFQDVKYCLATTSGGTAMQIALRAVGVQPGDKVLTNAFTLAPVPGAIAALGATPIFVQMTTDLTIDLVHLEKLLKETGSKYVLLSHMRGHLADMDALVGIIEAANAIMIEDCAHTMGAKWGGVKSGNFGKIACFSTQTYKHLNSGEGGFLTTNDPELLTRAIILSGSYMLFEKHVSRPEVPAFEEARFQMPNCSSRMDNLRAAILRPQLKNLAQNIERWNERYRVFEDVLLSSNKVETIFRPETEYYVGSSFQFLMPQGLDDVAHKEFVRACAARGVELKWFGDKNPVGFTSRYDSWHYAPEQSMPQTIKILMRVMDVRIPLTFSLDDCKICAEIIFNEAEKLVD